MLETTFKDKTRALCGDDGKKDTPVPIPNTEVKLLSADGSWTFGPVRVGRCHAGDLVEDGGLAQLGEHLPYKQGVSGSIPLTSIPRNMVPWCRG